MNIAREVLTIRQVAELLQVSPDTVYRLAGSGELRGRKIGRIWRFAREAVTEYLQTGTSYGFPEDETGGVAAGEGSAMT